MNILVRVLLLCFVALFTAACVGVPAPPDKVATDYLRAISQGDTDAVYYTKRYAYEILTHADKERARNIMIPARSATIKKGGLKEIVIDNVEKLRDDLVNVHYTLIFNKQNEIEKGSIVLEFEADWLVIQ